MKLFQLLEYANTQDIESAIELIKNDCKQFLSEADAPIFRGSKTLDADKLIQSRRVRVDRQPLDTVSVISNALDLALERIAGFKPRSQAVFATGDKATAHHYGKTFLIFPKGDFKFIYSERIRDFYSDIVLGTDDRLREKVFNIGEELLKKEYKVSNLKDTQLFARDDIDLYIMERDPYIIFEKAPEHIIVELVNKIIELNPTWYSTDDVNKGIHSKNELMIHCNEYYVVSENALFKHGIGLNVFFEKVKL